MGFGGSGPAGIQQVDERVAALRSILQSLPAGNYGVLKYLFMHLNRCVVRSSSRPPRARANLAAAC